MNWKRNVPALRVLLALLLLSCANDFAAELNPSPERPGNSTDDPIQKPKDLSGRSIKCARVRAVHSENAADEGATAYLTKVDPFLGYQRGRELFVREYSKADGVFGDSGKMAGGLLDDQVTKLMTRDHVASCAICHNVPFRDAGAGMTMFKNGGTGRNTTHMFGSGLVEMLGWQLRLKLLEKGDANRNGFIDKGESAHVRAIVENLPTGVSGERYSVDFGTFGDDGTGHPGLNSSIFVWYVDKDGKRISWARSLNDAAVAGYNFEVQVLGWGHGTGSLSAKRPMRSTLRGFSAEAFDNHIGMQADDPTLNEEPNQDGLAKISLLGAQQFYTGRTRDRGSVRDERNVSRDDPDRDGFLSEISEGDMDLIEFYQFNHPAPAEKQLTPRRERGHALMASTGCFRCHVPDWHLESDNRKDADYTRRYVGDRRFMNLLVAPNPVSGKLEGKLERLDQSVNGVSEPRRGAFTIRGVYSDFVQHDLGPKFHQMQFDGTVIKVFKTAPLWGVGSTAPYGHDGASLDLDDAIRRHGGEAATEAAAYAKLTDEDRDAMLDFLNSLVLYAVDDLPCDVDGDGTIAEHFVVAGMDTGVERLNPEWLFKIPGRIEGDVRNPQGTVIRSFALKNCEDAYGAHLKFLEDKDHDGFPDVLSPRKVVSQK